MMDTIKIFHDTDQKIVINRRGMKRVVMKVYGVIWDGSGEGGQNLIRFVSKSDVVFFVKMCQKVWSVKKWGTIGVLDFRPPPVFGIFCVKLCHTFFNIFDQFFDHFLSFLFSIF